MGLPPDLKVTAKGMIKASMGLTEDVMVDTRDTVIALSHELRRQQGMAGDDDAGRHFAKVYKSAASATLDQMGESAYVMGATGKALMRNAREFMAQDARTAAIFGKQGADPLAGMGDPGADCTEGFLGLGQDLAQVVGETAWYEQYAAGGRFRGSPEKLRDVAGSWRRAGKLMQRLLESAQACAHTADEAHSGEAATSFHWYFEQFVGFGEPPQKAQQDEPLVGNLVAACRQLDKACDRYAGHVEAAEKQITLNDLDFTRVDLPWHSPAVGGNGDDGGLLSAVLADSWIHDLGDVADALDESKAKVKLPRDAGDPPGFSLLPLLPGLVRGRVPVRLSLASAAGFSTMGGHGLSPTGQDVDPRIPPRDPIPPEPGTTRPLDPGERQRFRTWLNSLNTGGFSGGGDDTKPANAYQLRVSGYPERAVPLPEGGKGLMVDGVRPSDGYLVEAKYQKNSDDCTSKTYRNNRRMDEILAKRPKEGKNGNFAYDPHIDGMYRRDQQELDRYRKAMATNPEVRGLEIVTNSEGQKAYWNTMLGMTSTNASVRYVP